MISFMVLGGPRSATTWAANWLTTDTTFCIHDPLMTYTLRQLDQLTIPGRRIGISCTSSLLYPEWLLKHPARKIILHRKTVEINRSLEALGLMPLDPEAHNKRLLVMMNAKVQAWDWQELFSPREAPEIWKELLPDIPFDPWRHDLLTGMNIQPELRRLPVNKEAMTALVERCREVIS